jgi:hypothetical protein
VNVNVLRTRRLALAVALGLAAGCILPMESELLLDDVATAHQRWVAANPQDYTFELRLLCFCVYRGPIQVTVVNGSAVAATDSTGATVGGFTTTLGTLWDSILIAQANGRLAMAEFDQRGVPVEAEIGVMANDSGIHYSVRNFSRTR